MNTERCICCGDIIPEGRQICPKCEKHLPAATPNKSLAMALHCRANKMMIDRPSCQQCNYWNSEKLACSISRICSDVLQLLGI